MNNVQLIGRLTNDVDLKYTANNKAVATVTLAVNRTYKNQNGEREADFINLVLWGKVAENFSNWIKKGYLVAVTGAIRTRNYENQQGYRVYVTEVLVGAFQNLQPRDTSNSGNGDYGHTSNGFAGSGFGETFDISDDDLPF
jgi:single-stranded DNA-binding protein 3